jgi:hypothetical protein
MGTHWEQQKSNTPSLSPKGKKLGPLGAYLLISLQIITKFYVYFYSSSFLA